MMAPDFTEYQLSGGQMGEVWAHHKNECEWYSGLGECTTAAAAVAAIHKHHDEAHPDEARALCGDHFEDITDCDRPRGHAPEDGHHAELNW